MLQWNKNKTFITLVAVSALVAFSAVLGNFTW
jgi:hypothetical protein